MTSSSNIGFAQAAAALGVTIRVLRLAIRQGKLSAPAPVTAVTAFSPEWLEAAKATAKKSPDVFKDADRQKVPAFARYEGTSAWRKYSRRVRDFNTARAAA